MWHFFDTGTQPRCFPQLSGGISALFLSRLLVFYKAFLRQYTFLFTSIYLLPLPLCSISTSQVQINMTIYVNPLINLNHSMVICCSRSERKHRNGSGKRRDPGLSHSVWIIKVPLTHTTHSTEPHKHSTQSVALSLISTACSNQRRKRGSNTPPASVL